jgi:hypothetical protein
MCLLSQLKATLRRLGQQVGENLEEVSREFHDEVASGFATIRAEIDDFAARLKAWALAHPDETFALLRRLQPEPIAMWDRGRVLLTCSRGTDL